MRTQVHRDGTAELEAAAEWYECEEEGLGEELLEEVARGLAVISEGPMIWPVVRRRGSLRRFVAVCRYETGQLYRFSCDRNWETVNDMDHDSETEALADIPLNYDASKVKWVRRSSGAPEFRRNSSNS